jgi:hypothetical protein
MSLIKAVSTQNIMCKMVPINSNTSKIEINRYDVYFDKMYAMTTVPRISNSAKPNIRCL